VKVTTGQVLDDFAREGKMPPEVRSALRDALETIARQRDTCHNVLAASLLPVDDSIHVEGMRGGLQQIRDALRGLLVEDGE